MKSDKYDAIFKMNQDWANAKLKNDDAYFKKMYKEQSPDFLYIGCSDSRVSANLITCLDIGELFVHRNIGNLVSENDLNVMSVIQFAVEELKVKHIIVCGHYGCKGVGTVMQQQKLDGQLGEWLEAVSDIYTVNYKELDLIKDKGLRHNRLVELNVLEQCNNVLKTSFVRKAYAEHGSPSVHAWIYDMINGKLIDMDIDFESLRLGS